MQFFWVSHHPMSHNVIAIQSPYLCLSAASPLLLLLLLQSLLPPHSPLHSQSIEKVPSCRGDRPECPPDDRRRKHSGRESEETIRISRVKSRRHWKWCRVQLFDWIITKWMSRFFLVLTVKRCSQSQHLIYHFTTTTRMKKWSIFFLLLHIEESNSSFRLPCSARFCFPFIFTWMSTSSAQHAYREGTGSHPISHTSSGVYVDESTFRAKITPESNS